MTRPALSRAHWLSPPSGVSRDTTLPPMVRPVTVLLFSGSVTVALTVPAKKPPRPRPLAGATVQVLGLVLLPHRQVLSRPFELYAQWFASVPCVASVIRCVA